MNVLIFIYLFLFSCGQVLNITRNKEFCKLGKEPESCSCAEECDKYGDCCLDSKYFKPESQLWGASPFKCKSVEHTGIYFMQSCPPGHKQEHYCKYPKQNSPDILLDVPVTSNRTNITYFNSHCAICNEDFYANADNLWNIAFQCRYTGEFLFLMLETHGENLDDYINELDINDQSVDCMQYDQLYGWQINLTCKILKDNSGNKNLTDAILNNEPYISYCEVDFRKPNTVFEKVRECNPDLIGTCPANWNDKKLLQKCESYHDVYRSTYLTFRNPDCAQCWIDYEAPIYSTTGIAFRSFHVLLAHKLFNNGKCNIGEKYDPFSKRCRNLPKVTRDVSRSEDVKQFNETEIQPNDEDQAYTTNKTILTYITNICIPISMLCLVLHLAVFFATPKLRNLPSMNLASLSTALLLLYSSFFVSEFIEPPCVAVAVFIHYSLLATFSWMIVIAFDVLHVVRKSISDLHILTGTKWSRFAVYSLAAWLFPAVLVAISLVLDLTEADTEFAPGYGSTDCWIQNALAQILFVLAPLCVVMVFNLSFYSWTAWLIHTTRSQTVLKSTAKIDFLLFVKLAIIMGLTWVTAVIGSFTELVDVWYVFVLLNTLQGLFIFIAFRFNKRTRSQLALQITKLFGKTESSTQVIRL